MARKPRVIVNPVANHYSGDNERIIEFTSNDPNRASVGGLITLRRNDDGTLHIHVHALDAGVTVDVLQPSATALQAADYAADDR